MPAASRPGHTPSGRTAALPAVRLHGLARRAPAVPPGRQPVQRRSSLRRAPMPPTAYFRGAPVARCSRRSALTAARPSRADKRCRSRVPASPRAKSSRCPGRHPKRSLSGFSPDNSRHSLARRSAPATAAPALLNCFTLSRHLARNRGVTDLALAEALGRPQAASSASGAP